MMRRTLSLIAAAGAVLIVAGCGGQSADGDSSAVREPVPANAQVERGLPEGWESQVDQNRLGEQILAGWVEEGETFAVVTWGSSSCPPVAETMQVMAADRFTLVLGPSPNQICTMDMAPTTHTLELPEGLTERPIALTVELSEFDQSQTLTLE